MRLLSSLFLLVARMCVAAVFLIAGIHKFMNFDKTAEYMATKALPMVPVLLFGAALVEVLGGALLILGCKTRWAAAALALFLIAANVLFHDFWNLAGTDYDFQFTQFLKNLSILGGLMYIIKFGAGSWSCDNFKSKPSDVQRPVSPPREQP